MPRTLAIAAVQIAAHDRSSLAEVWPAIARRLREAAAGGAELIVLPEGTLPAYVLGYAPYEQSEIATALEECSALARELCAVLVVGAARRENGRTYNSAVVFDRDGSVAGTADKHFLWHFDRQWFAPGERIEPIRTSLGTLGVLVCADGRIPIIARALVDRGAEVLVMPTAWVTSGRDPTTLENIQADLLARVRARENGVPFVAANKCGVELGCVAYCGKSQIIAADGSIVAFGAQDAPQTIAARVETGAPRASRTSCSNLELPPVQRSRHAAVRIAIAPREFRDEAFMEQRLRMLEAELLVMPATTYPAPGNEEAPVLFVGDEIVLDPGGLAAHRLAGVDLAVWNTAIDLEWQAAFARARALELRMYVIVMDARGRAFSVDPDGSVTCGTFGDYEIAAFTYDPARSAQTVVAPGTDVRAGLERARNHAKR